MTKGNKKYEPVNIFWLVVFAAMLVIVIAEVSSASDRPLQSNDMNTQTAGDIAGDSSKALGIGFSSPSFGAAINQCIATEATNYFFGGYGKQKVVPNYHCMGLTYLQHGMLTAGELILCTHTELSDLGTDCPAAVAQYQRVVMPPPVSEEKDSINTSSMDGTLSGLVALVADMQVKQNALEMDYSEIPEPVVVERTVIQQTGIRDDQLEDLALVFKQ